MVRWYRSPPISWRCPPAHFHSQSQPYHPPLASPCHWHLGTTSGAFKKKKLSQRADEQPGASPASTHTNARSERRAFAQKQLYLCDDEPTGHPQAGFGSKMACDHNAEAGFWKSELGRAGVHDLIHHHNRATAVGLSGLN